MEYRGPVRRSLAASVLALGGAVAPVTACTYDFTIGTEPLPVEPREDGGSAAADAGEVPETICQDGRSCSCPGAGPCAITCLGSACTLGCGSASSCSATCTGGGCTVRCEAAATCETSCTGGSCTVDCGRTRSCDTACVGGGCRVACAEGQGCTISSCLGECTCTGDACR